MAEWADALTSLWVEAQPFDPAEYDEYLQWYVTSTRVSLVHHAQPDVMPAPATWDMYPSQSMSGSRQHAVQIINLSTIIYPYLYYPSFPNCLYHFQAELTWDLGNDIDQLDRSLSTGPLLTREQHRSWLKSAAQRVRQIYEAITCVRSSDVLPHAARRPPHPSTQLPQRRARRDVPPPPEAHRQHPRPRVAPPPPDQPGGSGWQQQSYHQGGYQKSPTGGYQQRPSSEYQQSPFTGFQPRGPHGMSIRTTTLSCTQTIYKITCYIKFLDSSTIRLRLGAYYLRALLGCFWLGESAGRVSRCGCGHPVAQHVQHSSFTTHTGYTAGR